MTTASAQHGSTATPEPQRSGWLGFAGALAIILGIFHGIEGLIALVRTDYFVTPAGRLLVFDYTTWGWLWLVVGVIQIIVGAGILAGSAWARAIGVVLTVLAMIGNFAFLAAYPVWAVINLTLCVLVIYGLVTPPRHATA